MISRRTEALRRSRQGLPAAALYVLLAAGFPASQPVLAGEPGDDAIASLISLMIGEYRSNPDELSDGTDSDLFLDRRIAVSAPYLGRHVVYWQLNTGENERLYRQRLLVFESAPERDAIRQSTWSFRDPGAWQDALEQPDRLASIDGDDIERTLPARCDLTWRRAEEGWAARMESGNCRIWSERRQAWRRLEAAAIVTAAAYWQVERGFDDAGVQVFGTPPGESQRLERMPAAAK